VVEQGGMPVFLVTFLGEEQTITPTEILAMILSRARKDAQSYLGSDGHIISAVIAVPSSFTFQQRQAIWDAAVIARLHPGRILSTATMICADYAFTQRSVELGNILVIDCGAGFLDVAIAIVENGVIQVKAVGGESFLGGDDFDSCLMELLLDRLNTSWLKLSASEKMMYPVVANSRLLRQLRTACEKAKCELSFQTQTHIEIDNLLPEHNLCETITQNDIVFSCNELCTQIAGPVALTMEDAQINRWAINTVLITGGLSRTPLVHSTLSNFLSKPEISRILKSNEAGARGAAFISAVLSGDKSLAANHKLLLLDVAPASIGIEVAGGTMCKILGKNTTLPGCKQVTLTTTKNQQEYSITVYEGEDVRVQNNRFLGQFTLRLAPSGVSQIIVIVNYDTSGEVHVGASEPNYGMCASRYFSVMNCISEANLKSTRITHARFDAAEKAEEIRMLAKHAVEGYVVSMLQQLNSLPSTCALQQQFELSVAFEAELTWLDKHPTASTKDYPVRQRRLEKLVDSIVSGFPEMNYLKRPGFSSGSIKHARELEIFNLGDARYSAPIAKAKHWEARRRHDDDMDQNRLPEDMASGTSNGSPLDTLAVQNVIANVVAGELDMVPQTTGLIDEAYHTALVDNAQARDSAMLGEEDGSMLEGESALVPTSTFASEGSAKLDRGHSVTLHSAESGMHHIFPDPKGSGAVFTDVEFVQIATYLHDMGRPSWSKVPRLYTVLRMTGQLSTLDTFIDQGTLLTLHRRSLIVNSVAVMSQGEAIQHSDIWSDDTRSISSYSPSRNDSSHHLQALPTCGFLSHRSLYQIHCRPQTEPDFLITQMLFYRRPWSSKSMQIANMFILHKTNHSHSM
jgi:heat shock protein 1/8